MTNEMTEETQKHISHVITSQFKPGFDMFMKRTSFQHLFFSLLPHPSSPHVSPHRVTQYNQQGSGVFYEERPLESAH